MEPTPKAEGPMWQEFGGDNLSVLERNILGAVIQRAILDYMSRSRADREHRRSAKRFLFSDDPEVSPIRMYAELLFTDPDGFLETLRKEVLAGNLRPKQVACSSC